MHLRPPAVAGTFYPDDAHALRAEVEAYVTRGASAAVADPARPPKAVIAPHAGYVYSGPVAGSAYAALAPWAKVIKRVILLGPSHRVSFPGLATSSAGAFATPGGAVALDGARLAEWIAAGWVRAFDPAHAEEHSLEVQLPFLQWALPEAVILPVLTGDGEPRAVEALLDRAWGGEETLVVVSSDLSHYLPYPTARQRDAAAAGRITRVDPRGVGHDEACGATAINGLLAVAARRGLGCQALDLRNSGDTAGRKDRVVGYGAFLFT
jgi:AmmeMemoRadiSam system protein B